MPDLVQLRLNGRLWNVLARMHENGSPFGTLQWHGQRFNFCKVSANGYGACRTSRQRAANCGGSQSTSASTARPGQPSDVGRRQTDLEVSASPASPRCWTRAIVMLQQLAGCSQPRTSTAHHMSQLNLLANQVRACL